MRQLLAYAVIAAAVVVLAWPDSAGAAAVENVAGSIHGALTGSGGFS
jgi:hypothetical protein